MPPIELRIEGRVAVITLNRPKVLNSINGELALALEEALDQIEADASVWVSVLSANMAGQARPVFCAGADLKAIRAGDAISIHTARGGFAGFTERDRTKPIIAAVDGLATAGGCEMVLACDIVIASRSSAFGLAEVQRNLVAGAGGLYRLPRIVGRMVGMDAILTGEPISAERAYQLGLVSRLVEPGEAINAALAVAKRICVNGPVAVRESRRVVLRSHTADDSTLIKMSQAAMRAVRNSEDFEEGIASFIEKRPAVWKGR